MAIRMVPFAVFVAVLPVLFSAMLPVAPDAVAQDVDLSHYIESVQVVLDDGAGLGAVTVVQRSSGPGDTTISDALDRDLLEHPRVLAVLFTNADACVPGVVDAACIIVNVARIPEETNIGMVQSGARAVGDTFISRLNAAFGTEAEFHSVFVHFNNVERDALRAPGLAMTPNTVSAVYTIPNDTTSHFYEKFVNTIFSPSIAQGGGFTDAAKVLSTHEDSFLLFVIEPGGLNSLYQLRLTKIYGDTLTDTINPLERLGVDELYRSSYFDDGFYPLNSLIRVAIASGVSPAVSGTASPILAGTGGAPDDVGERGWFFDPDRGTLIRGTFLFGDSDSVGVGQTGITLDMSPDNTGQTAQTPDGDNDTGGGMSDPTDTFAISDDKLLIVVIIVMACGGAAAFYLRGYRR